MLKSHKQYLFIILASVFIALQCMPVAVAWDDDTTHRDLSEIAAQRSILGNRYLENTLGIKEGLDSRLIWMGGATGTNKKISEWIQDGADFEDKSGRFYNHFHNPYLRDQPWTEAGLSDIVLGWPVRGESALLWAQNAGVSDRSNTDWSWKAARQHYYLALTAASKADRDAELAQTFIGLGHQIHLIQDMSQPSHVRNDAHPEDFIGSFPFRWLERLENWASGNQSLARTFMNQPAVFPTMGLNTSVNGLVPITALWDTDTYTYTSTSPPIGTDVGLAEYTNANFFSDNTINSPQIWHQFPFPSVNLQDYAICSDQAPPRSFATRRWYLSRLSRTPGGVCPQEGPDHFLVASFLPSTQPNLISPSSRMDNRVYEDYARELLPRAVGYSAALINYFFRGQLKVIPVSGGIQIQNSNTETMNYYIDPDTGNLIGSIRIYYDNTFSDRQLLASYNLPGALAPGELTPVITFTHPTDNIQPGRYIIVFRGKLGEEEGAVIGKVTAPLQVFYRADDGGVEKIYRVDIDGGNKTLVFDNTDPNIVIDQIAISPDQSQLAFTYGTNISLLDLSTGQITPLLPDQGTDVNRANPSWSPNGDRIVFDRGLSRILPSMPKNALFIRHIQTGAETQLTPLPDANGETFGFAIQPAWSPDGSLIAYALRVDDLPRQPDCLNDDVIALVDPAGQSQGRLTCDGSTAFSDKSPAWSPDNQTVVFSRRQPDQGLAYLYKVPRSGGAPIKLTDATGPSQIEFSPAYSPDGDWIAVASTRDGDFDIWLVDASSGAYVRNLTNENPGTDGNPTFRWAP
jgi:Tol biopolymer transport system component